MWCVVPPGGRTDRDCHTEPNSWCWSKGSADILAAGGSQAAQAGSARATRSHGELVITVSGLDPHQNYVPAKAVAEGRETGELLGEYEALPPRVRALVGHYLAAGLPEVPLASNSESSSGVCRSG